MATGAKRARVDVDEDEALEDSLSQDRNTESMQLNESRNSTSNTVSTDMIPISESSDILSHSDSQRQPSSADHRVPDRLCNWTLKNIDDLDIEVSFQPELSPFNLLTRPVPYTGGIGVRVSVYDVESIENREKEKNKRVIQLTNIIKRSRFMDLIQCLNYSSFEELNIDALLKLKSNELCFIPTGLPSDLKQWFFRFDTYGRSFIYVLSRMIENVIQGIPNLKHQFQHLFNTLVQMFGMQSAISCGPGLPMQTIQIGNVEVRGAPAIVYAHHRINEWEKKLDKPRIVVVCEVTKDKPRTLCSSVSGPSSKEVNNSNDVSSTTMKQEEINKSSPQLSEKLIGQHCGELLLSYGQSIGHSSIFGIVVQQTQVTFTELGMTNTQYQHIKAGKSKHQDGERPIFTYTRPYDFLKKEDLEVLIGSLIKFGIEQEQ